MKFSSGVKKEPMFILPYGLDGVGKTTFAASFPKCLVGDLEDGSSQISVYQRTDGVRTYEEYRALLKWLRNEKHDFESFATDTLDRLESEIWKFLIAKDKEGETHIESIAGGYQKGYGLALDIHREIIAELNDLRRNRNMNIIMLAHSKIVEVDDPRNNIKYARHTLKLQENKQYSACSLWRESVDAVLFCAYDDIVYKVDPKAKVAKAKTGDEVNKIFVKRTATYDAKNRYGLLQASYPLNYQAFVDAVSKADPNALEVIRVELMEICDQVKEKDAGTAEKMLEAVKAAGDNKSALVEIRNFARTLVAAQ